MEQNATAVATGAVTTSQKEKRGPRGRVRVFTNWCKGCGLCMAFCPRQVFEPDAEGRPEVTHPERCTACDWCRFHCPDLAITVTHLDEVEGGGTP